MDLKKKIKYIKRENYSIKIVLWTLTERKLE